MRSLSLIFVLYGCLAASCTDRPTIPDAFVGTWQSDTPRTLESVRNSAIVTTKDLAMFEDNFFGNRIIVYRTTEYAAYFVDEKKDLTFSRYDIVDFGPDFVSIRYAAFDFPEFKIARDAEIKTWRTDGEMIYVEEKPFGFREYYHRISD